MAGFDPGLGREEAGYLDHCTVVQVTQLPPACPRPAAHCTYDGSKQRLRICDFSSFAIVCGNVLRHGNHLQPGQHQRWLLAAVDMSGRAAQVSAKRARQAVAVPSRASVFAVVAGEEDGCLEAEGSSA